MSCGFCALSCRTQSQKSPPWACDKGCAEACAERFSALKLISALLKGPILIKYRSNKKNVRAVASLHIFSRWSIKYINCRAFKRLVSKQWTDDQTTRATAWMKFLHRISRILIIFKDYFLCLFSKRIVCKSEPEVHFYRKLRYAREDWQFQIKVPGFRGRALTP